MYEGDLRNVVNIAVGLLWPTTGRFMVPWLNPIFSLCSRQKRGGLPILKFQLLLIALAIGGPSLAQGSDPFQPLKVSITEVASGDQLSRHYLQLLTLALDKTILEYGPYRIVQNPHHGGIERDRAMLIAGEGIDVMWASVTRERREKMRVIPIDLLHGLNNYRLLLIRKGDQQRFASVKNLDDLRKFTAGTGVHWTDGRIMKNNNFNTNMSFSMPGLFKMLAAGRFDFISRGAHEVSNDLSIYPDYGFAVEDHLLLKYSEPVQYSFFVNKDNLRLAERIERGLKMAQADGSFDRISNQLPGLKEAESYIKQEHRQLIEIKNDIN